MNYNNYNHTYQPMQQPMYPQGYSNYPTYIPPEYRPISMWGYFGYQILFAIPVIGWIMLLVFALGGTSNINVRNFARSYFCILIILVVIIINAGVLGVIVGS